MKELATPATKTTEEKEARRKEKEEGEGKGRPREGRESQKATVSNRLSGEKEKAEQRR